MARFFIDRPVFAIVLAIIITLLGAIAGFSLPIAQYPNITKPRISVNTNYVGASADIVEKKGTSIRLTCLPGFDVSKQQIILKELEIQLVSRNILLKGAGWFARTFMGARLDKKVEEAVNTLYREHVKKLIKEGLHMKVPDGGVASVIVHSLTIDSLTFREKSISILVVIHGLWKLHLK